MLAEVITMITCKHCNSENIRKNGNNRGIQRYFCKSCCRTFAPRNQRFGEKQKAFALLMYLNNVGIRKCALFLGVSRQTISNWIEEAHEKYQDLLKACHCSNAESADIIEMDEIYTFVQKRGAGCSFGLLILDGQSALLRL